MGRPQYVVIMQRCCIQRLPLFICQYLRVFTLDQLIVTCRSSRLAACILKIKQGKGACFYFHYGNFHLILMFLVKSLNLSSALFGICEPRFFFSCPENEKWEN